MQFARSKHGVEVGVIELRPHPSAAANGMAIVEVLARVRRAAARLENDDRLLFELDANERTLTHRLALYLDSEFAGWNVDCEYNRRRHDPKVLDYQ